MLAALRSKLAHWLAPRHKPSARMYHSARASRLAGTAGSNSSADMELVTSLTTLRSRARQLRRDAPYAKRAQVIVVNNVIGSGIGMQGQVKTTRGELNATVNDAMEWAFIDWSKAENCHTGGVLHFHDFERAMMAQIFEAGEVFVRKHYRAFGRSNIPFALELIEAERIADETQPGPASPGNMVRMGIEVDTFYRPVAYWIRERHQGEFRLGVSQTDRYERVPADQIYHLKITDRWPQTRGEPWLHAVIRKLQDMDGYSEAEIIAARGAASYVWWITSNEDPNSPVVEQTESGAEISVEPGMAKHLAPGEDVVANTPNRPNTALDPFMRYMLREMAAGTGPSYESLSRDYSQSNYSSSRLALLDDRDLWRYFQAWFIRSFREPLHCEWLQQAVLARVVPIPVEAYAVDVQRYERVRFKPRGWSWIDPTKEVEASILAVRNGFDTTTDVIARTGEGKDIEDILETRERELKLMKEKGLKFDTDPDKLDDGTPIDTLKPDKPKPKAGVEAESADKEDEVKAEQVVEMMRDLAGAIRDSKPVINVPAPVVHVRAPEVTVQNNVAPTPVTVSPAEVRVENRVEPTPVTVAAPNVNLELKPEVRMDEVTLNVHSTVEVPPVEDTVQKLVRDDNREVTEIHTRRVREGKR